MTLRPEPYTRFLNEVTFQGLAQFKAEAEQRGVSMSGLALAWVMSHPLITAPIIGPRKIAHLSPVLEALSIQLTPSERVALSNLFPHF